jgi:hypothetical protein
MVGIAFESYGRLLVVLHVAAAIVLIGSTTHHFLIALNHVRGRYRLRLLRIYAATSLVAYLVTFFLGALAYPNYRYYVRALYFDRYEVWAANLFDIKENFASLGLPFVIAACLLSRTLEPREDQPLWTGYLVMVALVTMIVWFNVFAGLLLTLARGVG